MYNAQGNKQVKIWHIKQDLQLTLQPISSGTAHLFLSVNVAAWF
jgi:hypothetical protein